MYSKSMSKIRTTQSVEQNLYGSRRKRSNKGNNPYLQCVFRPFEHKLSLAHRPDGVGQHTVTLDFISNIDVAIAPSGVVTFLVAPVLPNTVCAHVTGLSATVGTTTFSANGTNLVPWSTSGTSTFVLPPPTPLSNGFFGNASATTFPTCTSARVLTQGWKLIYTGSVSTAAGTVQVDEVTAKCDTKVQMNSSTITYGSNAQPPVTITQAVNTARFRLIDLPTPTN